MSEEIVSVEEEAPSTDVTLLQDRIMSVIRLVLPLLIGGLTAFGIDVDADQLIVVIGVVVTAALSVWAWWKNNPITVNGHRVQNIFRSIKSEEKAEEAVDSE